MIEYLLKKGLFKNANHAIWFTCSIFFFIFVILLYYGKLGKYVFLLPIIFHLSPILNAININYIKKEKSEIYSDDCIWFNILMVICYIILMLVF